MNVQEEINNILIDDKKDRLSSDKSVGESEWRGWFKRVSSSDRWQEEQERKMEEVGDDEHEKQIDIEEYLASMSYEEHVKWENSKK